MKGKLLKTTVVSLVLLLVFGTGVYAGSNLEQISAYLNRGVTLTWNGVPFYPQEADGSRVFPITYNGRTYIPAKFIAEKAGLGVGWDGATSTVSFTTPDYVPPVVTRGTYTKVGNGIIKFMIDDFESITAAGYNVEEKMAETNYDTHKVRMTKVYGTADEKEQEYMGYISRMTQIVTTKQWNLASSTSLGGGHYKHVYVHEIQPLEMTMYSTNTEIIISTRRTDMNTTVNTQQVITSQSQEYFEGYFSSVPKPSMDSSWREEVVNELKDWSFGSYRAYTLSKRFYASESKVDAKFEEYKKTLVNNGFGLYQVQSDHYTYTKGDIAVDIFNANDNISVNLSSGYQAPHL